MNRRPCFCGIISLVLLTVTACSITSNHATVVNANKSSICSDTQLRVTTKGMVTSQGDAVGQDESLLYSITNVSTRRCGVRSYYPQVAVTKGVNRIPLQVKRMLPGVIPLVRPGGQAEGQYYQLAPNGYLSVQLSWSTDIGEGGCIVGGELGISILQLNSLKFPSQVIRRICGSSVRATRIFDPRALGRPREPGGKLVTRPARP